MLSDYNFETPGQSLAATAAGTVRIAGNDRLEVFDYPGCFSKRAARVSSWPRCASRKSKAVR